MKLRNLAFVKAWSDLRTYAKMSALLIFFVSLDRMARAQTAISVVNHVSISADKQRFEIHTT